MAIVTTKYENGGSEHTKASLLSVNYTCQINIGNHHWIFARIRFKQNMIEVWNSSGCQPANGTYLTQAIQCLYDELKFTSPRLLHTFEVWGKSLTLKDRLGDSPQQTNDHDGRFFTLVSVALLGHWVSLTKVSYNQYMVYCLATRHRIACLILTSSRGNINTYSSRIVGFVRPRAPPPTTAATKHITLSLKKKWRCYQKKKQRCVTGISNTAKCVITHPT